MHRLTIGQRFHLKENSEPDLPLEITIVGFHQFDNRMPTIWMADCNDGSSMSEGVILQEYDEIVDE